MATVVSGFNDPVVGPGLPRSLGGRQAGLSFLFTSGREMDPELAAVVRALGLQHLMS